MSADLLERKLRHVAATGAACVVTANPGFHLQLEHGLKTRTNLRGLTVRHPASLLAEAYRQEPAAAPARTMATTTASG